MKLPCLQIKNNFSDIHNAISRDNPRKFCEKTFYLKSVREDFVRKPLCDSESKFERQYGMGLNNAWISQFEADMESKIKNCSRNFSDIMSDDIALLKPNILHGYSFCMEEISRTIASLLKMKVPKKEDFIMKEIGYHLGYVPLKINRANRRRGPKHILSDLSRRTTRKQVAFGMRNLNSQI